MRRGWLFPLFSQVGASGRHHGPAGRQRRVRPHLLFVSRVVVLLCVTVGLVGLLGAVHADTVGLYNPATGNFYLRNSNSAGAADLTFRYGPTSSSWLPVVGDWDGDAVVTIGLYHQSPGNFYLRNSNSAGAANLTFRFGPTASAWLPISGDWNGDDTVTIGLYNQATGTFYLRNSNGGGAADLVFRFGPTASNWLPIAGDWNADGTDTIGLYNPATSTFYLRNANAGGPADLTFRFGPAPNSWLPIAGDWDYDRDDTVGLYSPTAGTFYLRNANAAGAADVMFRYGPAPSTWKPIAGDWVQEQSIRQLYEQFEQSIEAEDLDGLMSLFSDSFLHRGRSKQDLQNEASELFASRSGIEVTISDLVIGVSGDTAVAALSLSLASNEQPVDRNDLSPEDDSIGICFLRKENGNWVFYGDQSRCWPECALAYWDEWGDVPPPGGYPWHQTSYQLELRVDSTSAYPITSVQCSGPLIEGGSVALNYDPEDVEWQVGAHGFYTVASPPPVGTWYTFDIAYADGSSDRICRQIRAIPPNSAPVITEPSGFILTPTAGEAVVAWEYDPTLMPDAKWYEVELWGPAYFHQFEDLPLETSSVGFLASELLDGCCYRLDVSIADRYGNSSDGIRWVWFESGG